MSFQRVAQTEFMDLRDGRGELASIKLGEFEGRWFYALSFQQRGGDCWGFSAPLGFSLLDPGAELAFPTRDDALAGAIAKCRSLWADRPEMAPHRAWLDALLPDQPDLFASLQSQEAA